jgi:restriction system protein
LLGLQTGQPGLVVRIISFDVTSVYSHCSRDTHNAFFRSTKKEARFVQEQSAFNDPIDQMRDAYFNRNTDSITEYCEIVLNSSCYLDSFLQNFELEYNPNTKILIVEYELPSMDRFLKTKEVQGREINMVSQART